MRRPQSLVRTATIFAALGSGACVAVFGMDKLTEGSHPSAVDGGSDAGDAAPAVCALDAIGLPAKPSADTAGVDLDAVNFVFSAIDIGLSAEQKGFNLDHFVTKDSTQNSCAYSPDAATSLLEQYSVDPPDGVDNATSGMMRVIGDFFDGLSPVAINGRLQERYFGFAVRIEGWNGKPNDDSVRVYILPLLGDGRYDDAGTFVPRTPGLTGPFWNDLWIPDSRFILGETGSKNRSDVAWVADGKLVAHFSDPLTAPLRTSSDDLASTEVVVHDAWLTATIVPARDPDNDASTPLENAFDGGDSHHPWLAHGLVAGRADIETLLQSAVLLASEDGGYKCADGEFFQLAQNYLCGARDIRLDHCDDNKALPCNGLSYAIGFEAYAVERFGPPHERTDQEYRDYWDAGGRGVPPGERCPSVGKIRCP